MNPATNSIEARMRDNDRIRQALRKSIQDALREHKLLGYPIVVWKDGKVTWIPPEEIELESEKNSPANGESAKGAG